MIFELVAKHPSPLNELLVKGVHLIFKPLLFASIWGIPL